MLHEGKLRMEGDADGELFFYHASGERLVAERRDPAGSRNHFSEYTDEQARLLSIIGNRGGWHLDVLVAASGLSPQRLQVAITQLELLGRLTRDQAFRIHPT